MKSARIGLPDGRELAYTLKRSARRSIGLRIGPDGLSITLPLRAPQADAERAIFQKLDWILPRLVSRPSAETPQLRAGAPFFWLGEAVVLAAGAGRTRLDGELLHVAAEDEAGMSVALARFMKRRAAEFLPQRVAYWSARMGLQPARVGLSSARRRWGSCAAHGGIRLNWRLMQAPPAAIDYVVIHELAHLAELNHSPRFWALVEVHCPDWKHQRDWLKRHGAQLLGW
ncbi:hypothetical protein SAMN05660284_00421 [Formivibrio citricus]|uniref:YgjP-like metallopeptidase domain-containing protein n=1 Tax=Formivibrio citricus TaxID=83765 RepID=A0A1I4VWG9_9NEIS|nr:SprT family zinc-dependent metalloprotease [Formivibrio citricus]SFN05668.1 hypothetical protein SAMN05660284_00421 [Formivibrio citricus]